MCHFQSTGSLLCRPPAYKVTSPSTGIVTQRIQSCLSLAKRELSYLYRVFCKRFSRFRRLPARAHMRNTQPLRLSPGPLDYVRCAVGTVSPDLYTWFEDCPWAPHASNIWGCFPSTNHVTLQIRSRLPISKWELPYLHKVFSEWFFQAPAPPSKGSYARAPLSEFRLARFRLMCRRGPRSGSTRTGASISPNFRLGRVSKWGDNSNNMER